MIRVHVSSMCNYLQFWSFHLWLTQSKNRKEEKNKRILINFQLLKLFKRDRDQDHRFSYFEEMTLVMFKLCDQLLHTETVYNRQLFFFLFCWFYFYMFRSYAFSLSPSLLSIILCYYFLFCSNQFLAITGKHLFKFHYYFCCCLCLYLCL